MVTPYERPRTRSNTVYKNGPLLISSKGLGWKSWKRRWFMLTRTSLVFFKDDPNILPHKASDVLPLGGIDLNNSGSVVVREDKRLLTVMFPDGRGFTLKAESPEDVEEWKAALERALAAAPNAALVMGHDGIFRNDSIDAVETSTEIGKDRRSVKSMVVGRPILLALEDIDGSPSFLEKALCFIERYGVKSEGILRQSADVEEVELRIQDYEQGKSHFAPEEDPHVVSDCVKLVLRELPSSPVPTPCCTALLEAHRNESKEARVSSMQLAVAETFPEPNRRLLQRVLKMGRAVAAHISENRMSASAVAACMAPLLLRPLLAGECGLEDDSDISGDNAAQLLAATMAANNAQAIVTTLLEEYDNIFEDYDQQGGPPSPEMYPNLEGSETGESSEDEVLQITEPEGYHDAQASPVADHDEDPERVLSGTLSESSSNLGSDAYDYKGVYEREADVESPAKTKRVPRPGRTGSRAGEIPANRGISLWDDGLQDHISARLNSNMRSQASTSSKYTPPWATSSISNKMDNNMDDSGDEESAIQRLELTRNELRAKIAKETKGNAILQASLERRKQALHERRMTLEQDVTKLHEQLQSERQLRAALEAGLSFSTGENMDFHTRAELEEIAVVEADVAKLKQKVAELHLQLSQQRQQQGSPYSETSDRLQRYKTLQAQQKMLQQELDLTLALCHHERQRNDELEGQSAQDASALEHVLAQQRNALAEAKEALKLERVRGHDLRRRTPDPNRPDWRTLQPPAGPSSVSSRQFAWKNNQTEHHNQNNNMNLPVVDNPGRPNSSPVHERGSFMMRRIERETSEAAAGGGLITRRQASPAPPLVELNTRLDYFKERRSHLQEELQNLDPSLAAATNTTVHDSNEDSPLLGASASPVMSP